MTDPTITLEVHGARGRYMIVLSDGQEAEMTFGLEGAVMTIDHTGVPPAHEGHGLAARLLDRAIADARAQKLKIRPRCSYVMAQFTRHAKEWADVLAP